MYAIIETGGKQYKVEEGQTLKVEKLALDEGAEVLFDNVKAVSGAEGFQIGQPQVEGAQVKATVIEQGKGNKIVIFKYKPKTNYRKKMGHRQPYTKVVVEEILA